ncbi:hypothetical protein CVT24_001932 [Panaeolus cyanescens]|uniref:Uncharacterized protein n=1 Tax=Panaeolus cyanescens TaxID=181874 RepID=A0A409WB04_9AGAR|nr:hypothetical protein CVT24_001932 [Panaeolus cyanescens]
MADARALLKAKRQEARISHPHATYTSAGQLKCILCAAPVKFASAWEGHLGSKVHRTNLARLREEEKLEKERLQREQQEEESHKRKRSALVDHDVSEDDEMDTDESRESKKRRPDSDKPTSSSAPSAGGFPQDFFSDPSRKPELLSPDSDEENEDENTMSVDPPKPDAAAKPTSEVDLEYERFQRELLQQSASSEEKVEAFERATVFAEPQLTTEVEAGFPAKDAEQATVDPANTIPPEEEIRQKREQEERELIMDRLLDEERAQEDADNRVLQMKSRLEAIRKRKGLKKQK